MKEAAILTPSDSERGDALASHCLIFTSNPLGGAWAGDLKAKELELRDLGKLSSNSLNDCLMVFGVTHESISDGLSDQGSSSVKIFIVPIRGMEAPIQGSLPLPQRLESPC